MTQSEPALNALLEALARDLLGRGWLCATAESCTGGLVSAACTELAGSSRWFERGIVSYSNRAKQNLLGVPESILNHDGAVSAATVQAMAEGLLRCAPVQLSAAVSGIAGPDGGSADKPVGTVWMAWAGSGTATRVQRFQFAGDRAAVRVQAVRACIEGMLAQLESAPVPSDSTHSRPV